MIRDRLAQGDARYGRVMLGYPLTLKQVNQLDRFCVDCGVTLDLVLALGVPDPDPTLLRTREPCGGAALGRADTEYPAGQLLRWKQFEPCLAACHRRGILQWWMAGGTLPMSRCDASRLRMLRAARPPPDSGERKVRSASRRFSRLHAARNAADRGRDLAS